MERGRSEGGTARWLYRRSGSTSKRYVYISPRPSSPSSTNYHPTNQPQAPPPHPPPKPLPSPPNPPPHTLTLQKPVSPTLSHHKKPVSPTPHPSSHSARRHTHLRAEQGKRRRLLTHSNECARSMFFNLAPLSTLYSSWKRRRQALAFLGAVC